MSWTSLARWRDRVEIRLAATLLMLAAPVLAAALFMFLAYAAHEMLEQRGELAASVAAIAAEALGGSPDVRLGDPLYDLVEREQMALRILDDHGTVVAERGHDAWFGERVRDTRAFWDAVRADQRDVLVVERRIGPLRLEVAASLEAFAKERGELLTGFWISLLVGLLGSALFAVIAARRALRPLHEATDAIGAVDANQLQTRLPLRHTGDAVDLHAEALNRVLDRLEKGFARIRAFSADVAHELRTPINRLLNQSGARLLAEQGGDEFAYRVQSTAEEMQGTVEGLLLLAQADEGRLQPQMLEIRLGHLLNALEELYRPACDERDILLEVKTEDLATIGDEGLLVRLLGNLIDNALGHTPEGGRIVIDAAAHEAGLLIRVCDSGSGVPSADLERIFDRFVRVDPTGPRRGAGLGLSIARAISVAHGGNLRAVPAPGGGTCFEIWLPKVIEPAVGPEQPGATSTREVGGAGA